MTHAQVISEEPIRIKHLIMPFCSLSYHIYSAKPLQEREEIGEK